MKTAWTLLLLAGAGEVIWSVALSYSHGFTRLWPSVVTAVVMLASFLLLAKAMQTIPLGTAYAVFTGIGAVGAAVYGMLMLNEPITPARLVLLAGLILCIIGLKLVSASKPAPKEKPAAVTADVGLPNKVTSPSC